MSEYQFGYREVIPDQAAPESWKEISLTTGGTQSTLQDIKVSEKANGYCYKDASKYYTRNRFIYWRKNHDILELVEQSLDVNLTGNRLKYRFIDTPILDGISIHETFNAVVVLVPTVCSVHRLIFPHPDRLHKQDELLNSHPGLTFPSIFCDANASHARDLSVSYIFNNPSSSGSQLPHVAASLLTSNEDALFVLGFPTEELLLVKQLADGTNLSVELKHDSLMPRFLSGIAQKFRSRHNDGGVTVSILLHTINLDTYAFTVSKDGHLRIWCCSKVQCVSDTDILAESGDAGRHLLHGGQNHIMRKANSCNDDELILAVYMYFQSECVFYVLRPSVVIGMQFQVSRINTLHSPAQDLVDFALTNSRIWSLWRTDDGDTSVYTAVFNTKRGSIWIPVTLETFPDINPVLERGEIEPKQAYMDYIFYPGRFPLHVISKALSIYKRSSLLSEVSSSLNVLKQRVTMAVESEIQEKVKETEVNDEDYLECASWCWARFHSCCIQYHAAGLRPLGLLLLPSVSGAVVLKKSFFSFLRPLDGLEHLMLCCDYSSMEQFIHHPLLSDNFDVIEDVIQLMEVIVYLESQLSDEFKESFRIEMESLKSPDVVVSEMVMEIQTELDDQFILAIAERLNNCADIYQATHKLLEMLRIDNQFDVEGNEDYKEDAIYTNHLFSSQLGISTLVQCLQQQAQIKFSICRNLLIAQNLLMKRNDRDWNVLEAVRSICTPEIVVLTQASFAMFYLSLLPSHPNTPSDAMFQKLAPLKLAPVFNLRKTSNQNIFLLEHFVSSTFGLEAYKNLVKSSSDEDTITHWHVSLLSVLQQIGSAIWPINMNSSFSEWLLTSCQHLWLQQYCRLLKNWCQWDICTRTFLLAVMFLSNGEFQKAEDLFLKAVEGVTNEKFLVEHILTEPEFRSQERAPVAYYLKVIQLFELHGARDHCINVATTAIAIADEDDPIVATLYSIKFIHHLALRHYDQAYVSLNANPDLDRQKDNLRELVKVLLDLNEVDILMSFPFRDMEDIFCNILLTRARATDSVYNIYYECLYSYQLNRGPSFMKDAACVMYEHAYRLAIYNTVEALEMQVKCYLTSINVLYLCEEKDAWVARPVDSNTEDEIDNTDKSKKNDTKKKETNIATLDDVKKELEFASARLKLVKFNKVALTIHTILPSELVVVMSHMGLFKWAITLSNTFDLSLAPVFESLTRKSVRLINCDDPRAWTWLIENDIHDLNVVGKSSADVSWALLKRYLTQYEEENMSRWHKVACVQIINMAFFIPYWLWASYIKRNASELLRILLFSGRLYEAVDLAKDYILAAMGYGKDLFNFQHSLLHSAPPFCLPTNIIQLLLYELKLQNQGLKKPFEKKHKLLRELFQKYVEISTRITNELIQTAKYIPPKTVKV